MAQNHWKHTRNQLETHAENHTAGNHTQNEVAYAQNQANTQTESDATESIETLTDWISMAALARIVRVLIDSAPRQALIVDAAPETAGMLGETTR